MSSPSFGFCRASVDITEHLFVSRGRFWNDPEVTSQGSAASRFQKAIEKGILFQAELAAREMGGLSLGHALALCRLMAEQGDPRAERAAVRWVARLLAEKEIATLAEAQLILAAISGAEADPSGWQIVERLASRRGVVV